VNRVRNVVGLARREHEGKRSSINDVRFRPDHDKTSYKSRSLPSCAEDTEREKDFNRVCRRPKRRSTPTTRLHGSVLMRAPSKEQNEKRYAEDNTRQITFVAPRRRMSRARRGLRPNRLGGGARRPRGEPVDSFTVRLRRRRRHHGRPRGRLRARTIAPSLCNYYCYCCC
jgi:hypothetical protein